MIDNRSTGTNIIYVLEGIETNVILMLLIYCRGIFSILLKCSANCIKKLIQIMLIFLCVVILNTAEKNLPSGKQTSMNI